MNRKPGTYGGGRALIDRMITELRRLQDLFDVSYQLNAILDRVRLRDRILDIALERSSASKGLLLVRIEDDLFEERASNGVSLSGKKGTVNGLLQIPAFPPAATVIRRNHSGGKGEEPDTSGWIETLLSTGIEVVVPMTSSGKPLAMLCLGRRRGGRSYDPLLLDYLDTMATTAAIALSNSLTVDEVRRLNSELDSKVREQEDLFRIASQIAAHFDIPHIMESVGIAMKERLGLDKYFISLMKKGRISVESSFGIDEDLLYRVVDTPEVTGMLGSIDHTVILVGSGRTEIAGMEPLVRLGISAVVPLKAGGDVTGFICIGRKSRKKTGSGSVGRDGRSDSSTVSGQEDETGPSPESLLFIEALGSHVTSALENAFLFRQAVERERMQEELKIAAGIQERLLPDTIPEMRTFEISAHTMSCLEVGGDYLDFLELGEGRLLIAIGDVTGKGVPAALLMSNLQAGLHILVGDTFDLASTAARLNNLITRNTEPERFVTFFFGILDDERGTLEYINAGHNPPLMISASGAVTELHEGGIILGVMENTIYRTGRVTFSPGDIMVMFTDGVTECRNREGIEFGTERILTIVESMKHESAGAIRAVLEKAVYEYPGGGDMQDDMTLGVIRMRES